MRIVKDGREQHDDWTLLGADEPVGDRLVLVPLARWQSASPVVGISPYGLLVRADDALAAVLAAAGRSPLVAIEFVTFTDGRGYSFARLLRANGFDGDLRAVGEVLRDQAFFLARCGFSSCAPAAHVTSADFIAGLADFSGVYQAAADERRTIARLRHAR